MRGNWMTRISAASTAQPRRDIPSGFTQALLAPGSCRGAGSEGDSCFFSDSLRLTWPINPLGGEFRGERRRNVRATTLEVKRGRLPEEVVYLTPQRFSSARCSA